MPSMRIKANASGNPAKFCEMFMIGMNHFFRITQEDIRALALLHQAGYEREKIEDVLDVCCGYMTELSLLRAHDYDALVSRKNAKKKAKQRAV